MDLQELLESYKDICFNCRCELEDSAKVYLDSNIGSVTLRLMCAELLRRNTDNESMSFTSEAYPPCLCQNCCETVTGIYNFRQSFQARYERYKNECEDVRARQGETDFVEKSVKGVEDATQEDVNYSSPPQLSLPPPTSVQTSVQPKRDTTEKKHKLKPLEIPRIKVISPYESVSQTSGSGDLETREAPAESTGPATSSVFLSNTYGTLPTSLLPFTLSNSAPSTPSKILTTNVVEFTQPLDLTKESQLTVESPFKLLFSPLLSSFSHFSFNFASPLHSPSKLDEVQVETLASSSTHHPSTSSSNQYSYTDIASDQGVCGVSGGNEGQALPDLNNNDSNSSSQNQNYANNYMQSYFPTGKASIPASYYSSVQNDIPTSQQPQPAAVSYSHPTQYYTIHRGETIVTDARYANSYFNTDANNTAIALRVSETLPSPVLNGSLEAISAPVTPVPVPYTPSPSLSTASSSGMLTSNSFGMSPYISNNESTAVMAHAQSLRCRPAAKMTPAGKRKVEQRMYVEEDEPPQLTKCPKCDRYFQSRSLYLDHKLAVHSLDQMSCFLCGCLVLGLTHLADHIRTVHLDDHDVNLNTSNIIGGVVNNNLGSVRILPKLVGPKRKHSVQYNTDSGSNIGSPALFKFQRLGN